MPIKKGFIHVLQDMREMFPRVSGKITVQLEGLGETNLRFDAKNNRVYGLTKRFRLKDVRPRKNSKRNQPARQKPLGMG